MSRIKTGQIIFRMVKGRIIPILSKGKNPIIQAQKRAAGRLIKSGAAPKPVGQLKKKLGKHWKLLSGWSQRGFTKSKSGKILMPRVDESSGSPGMFRFIEKTGAIRWGRFQHSQSVIIDKARPITTSQTRTLKAFTGDKAVITNKGDYYNLQRFLVEEGQKKLSNIGKKASSGRIANIEKKLIKKYGETSNPYSAGYIMPSGKGIDFSGRNMGSGSYVRSLDHREVSNIFKAPRESKKRLGTFLKEAQKERKQYATLKYMEKGPIKFEIFGTGLSVTRKKAKSVKSEVVKLLRRHSKLTTRSQRSKVFQDLKKLK